MKILGFKNPIWLFVIGSLAFLFSNNTAENFDSYEVVEGHFKYRSNTSGFMIKCLIAMVGIVVGVIGFSALLVDTVDFTKKSSIEYVRSCSDTFDTFYNRSESAAMRKGQEDFSALGMIIDLNEAQESADSIKRGFEKLYLNDDFWQ